MFKFDNNNPLWKNRKHTFIFSNNNIDRINGSLFKHIKLTALLMDNNILRIFKNNTLSKHTYFFYINLNYNKIIKIEKNSFKTNINIVRIELSHNKLTFLDRNLFKFNRKLAILSLGYNDIKVFTPDLTNNINMVNMALENNILESVDHKWNHLSKLKQLSVHNNMLSNFSVELFRLKSIKKLSVYNNTFICGNSLKWILKFNFTYLDESAKYENDVYCSRNDNDNNFTIYDFISNYTGKYDESRTFLKNSNYSS